VVSGKNINKFEQCGLKTQPATKVDVPVLTDSPLALECVVREVIPMETHHLFVADIVAVDVEEALVDKEGKLHLNRAGLAAYAHGEYFALGDKLGKFGFSVQKKKKKRKRK
jgi:flavin reductase (DIM6/NTAB) family NADH-FMN oxidoreductase RutF